MSQAGKDKKMNRASTKKLKAAAYGLEDFLCFEAESKFIEGDHVAMLTGAEDWDYGWRVFEVRDNDVIIKKAELMERIPSKDVPKRLKTDVTGAMAAYRTINKSERSELREVFTLFDVDGDGHISSAEIMGLLKRLAPGKRFTETDAMNMIARFDDDGDGDIDFEEFVKMMSASFENLKEADELQEVFKLFDADGNGSISCEELLEIMKATGEDITLDEVKLMIEDVDSDGNGQIDFHEFKKVIQDGPV